MKDLSRILAYNILPVPPGYEFNMLLRPEKERLLNAIDNGDTTFTEGDYCECGCNCYVFKLNNSTLCVPDELVELVEKPVYGERL